MKNIALIPNTYKQDWKKHLIKIATKLISLDKTILINNALKTSLTGLLDEDRVFFHDIDEVFKLSDLVITLGGDGTLLGAAKAAAKNSVPLLGINIGTLGYLVELEINEIDLLERVFLGDFFYDRRDMLEITIIRNNHAVYCFHALNEALISKGEVSKLIEIDFYADNKFINSYRADGLIIATPTGSTAYSLSAGGPIIEPKTKSVVITPVCPHSLASIPIVMPIDSLFEIKIKELPGRDPYVTADGGEHFRVFENDIVQIKKSKHTTSLIRIKDRNFYAILRQKLEERIW